MAAIVHTNWGNRWQCDLLSADHDRSAWQSVLWPEAVDQMESLGANPVELMVRPEDRDLIQAMTRVGFCGW